MTEILILLILNSLYCIGLHAATRWLEYPEHIQELEEHDSKWVTRKLLWPLSYYTRTWPDLIRDPLTECLTCMASIHGGYVFVLASVFWGITPYLVIPYIIALAGLNTILGSWTRF